MKKNLIILLAVLQISSLFTACSQNFDSSPRVLEVYNETYASSEFANDLNHSWEIGADTHYTDTRLSAEKTFSFMDKTFSLKYLNSSSSEINPRHYHRYITPEQEANSLIIRFPILFDSNGELICLSCDPIDDSLGIIEGVTENTSPEEVAQLVQENLATYIDFSYHTIRSIQESKNYFDIYWKHEINGFQSSKIHVAIRKDGNLIQIELPPSEPQISDIEYEEALKKCPPETHKTLLQAKLDQIFNTDTIEYKADNWHLQSSSLVSYEGKPAIQYGIGLEFRKKNEEAYWGYLCYLVIVLE